MYSVTVLMSTYNGEQYLREQINSVLNQTGVNISLLIRDDGSSDSTISILREYAEKYSNVSFYQGDNVGPQKSFLDLVKKSGDTDFYAFSDQDDVWDEDKLITAVKKLEELPEGIPTLYHSNLRIVDSDMNFYRLSHSVPAVQDNKYSALVDSMPTGCTCVFNKVTRDLVNAKEPRQISMHDTWLYLICTFLGQVIYDFDAHISYRQHGGNVVGTYLGKRTIDIYFKRIARLFDRKLQPRYNNAKSLYDCYESLLKSEDKAKIREIIDYKKSLKNKWKLFRDKEICGYTKEREYSYRFLIILGII